MSGAELIGLISGIITLVEASRALYNVASDSSGLPQSFRDVAARLPAVQETLEAARDGLKADSSSSTSSTSRDALVPVLASCRDKAASLNKILQAAVPAADAPRTERYLKALRTISSAGKVEGLMEGILRDLEVLAGSHAVKAATRAQVERLVDAITRPHGEGEAGGENGGGGPGVSGPAAPVTLHNAGLGSQYVHTGHGNQNVASGRGIQINTASAGPFDLRRMEERVKDERD